MPAAAFPSHPRLRARSSTWGRRCVLCMCALGLGSPALREWALALALRFASYWQCLSLFNFSDPLLGVPDGNDTNNQPTQGPRHYDTLTTKIFYGNLLSQNLKDYAAALLVDEEVAQG